MIEYLPLYRRIRSMIAAMILDGRLGDGDAMPSVRSIAADLRVNPLTVAKGYASLSEGGVVEPRQGVGFFVAPGGTALLKEIERAKFLAHDWPPLAREIKMLGLERGDLLQAERVTPLPQSD